MNLRKKPMINVRARVRNNPPTKKCVFYSPKAIMNSFCYEHEIQIYEGCLDVI